MARSSPILVVALADAVRVYRPSEAGWETVSALDTPGIRALVADPRPGPPASRGAGALRVGTEDGATWIDRTPSSPRDTHGLVDHPARPGRLYAAAGDGYFESRDHGDSWTTPRQGLAHGYAWSVAVDRSDPDLRLLTASSGARWAHDAERASSVVYRRTSDAGWTLCMDGLGASGGTTVGTLAADPGLRGCFWIATNRGISVSTDGGRSWLAVAVDWPERFRRQRVEGFVVLR